MSEQRGHVFATVAQRRQPEVDDVQAMIQIFAEAAFAYERQQLHIGSGDDADIDLNLFRAAQAHEFALLDNAKELGLRFRADGGDFVEENRALVGDFEEAFLGSHGAGERALDVTEKLRFEKVDRNGAGVDWHERLVRACRRGVDGLGDELLARSAFAADEDGGA